MTGNTSQRQETAQCSAEKSCRRRESEYSCVLKTRKLLIFRDAKNAEKGKIVPNWNLFGTRYFQFFFFCQFRQVFLGRKQISNRANRFEPPNSLSRTPGHFTVHFGASAAVDSRQTSTMLTPGSTIGFQVQRKMVPMAYMDHVRLL